MSGAEHVRPLGGDAVCADGSTGGVALDARVVRRMRPLTAAEIAWVALVPCVVVALAVAIVLGPPLGRTLVRPHADALWPPTWWIARGFPKHAEYGRYVIAALAPFILSGVVIWGVRRRLTMADTAVIVLVLAGQLLVIAVVAIALLGQRNLVLVDDFWTLPPIFRVRTLVLSALLVLGSVAVLRRRPQIKDTLVCWAKETPVRRVGCLVLAVAFATALMLDAVTTDRLSEDNGTINWTVNDAFAVLNGRTPLVDFHVVYGKLVPYVAAATMAVFGTTTLVYTLTMMAGSAAAFVAVYAVLRRVIRNSFAALATFVPFVAMSGVGHATLMPSVWPMRYAGAYLMAWLSARHIDRVRPCRASIIFFVGGLVVVNNMEFGMGAVLATLLALLCARLPCRPRDVLRLAGAALGGLFAAGVVVAGFTLLRAGALPSVTVLMEWPRIFTNLGWFALPMPVAGVHLAIYLTFAATLVVAAVRIARSADDVLLTSMLVWAGVFGLVAGMYYVGRSDHTRLISMFSAWAFALVLLTVVSVRALAERRWRRLEPAQLLVLFGFALAVCSIGMMTPPQEHLARLTDPAPDPMYRDAAKRFVGARTAPDETVVILLPLGHRIADELSLRNVAPYGLQNAVVTRSQMRTVLATARTEGVRRIFVPAPGARIAGEGDTAPEQLLMYAQAGFPVTASMAGMLELRRGGGP